MYANKLEYTMVQYTNSTLHVVNFTIDIRNGLCIKFSSAKIVNKIIYKINISMYSIKPKFFPIFDSLLKREI